MILRNIVLYFSSANSYFSAITPTTSSSYIPSTMSYPGKYPLHCPPFHSGTSSFYLHIFICFYWHDTLTKFFPVNNNPFRNGFIPDRFSFQMKFSFLYEISFWKRTSFQTENRKSGSLRRLAHEYAKTMLSPSVLSCECSTSLTVESMIPRWKSFRYHINSP